MAPKYRKALPHVGTEKLFLTDGSLATFLHYEMKMDLSYEGCSSFALLRERSQREMLRYYYEQFLQMAIEEFHVGFVLNTSSTWKASLERCKADLDMTEEEWLRLTKESVEMLVELRADYENSVKNCPSIPISGLIGPKADAFGITDKDKMTVEEAHQYHLGQIKAFANETDADFVTASTFTYQEEAIGAVKAAQDVQMPIVIGFTIEGNGRLPDGTTLKDAILEVDAETGKGPLYYTINCAHPNHFPTELYGPEEFWSLRIQSIRCNASTKTHAQLDSKTVLDDGDPMVLGRLCGELRRKSQQRLNIIGGCCGTDLRHIKQIAVNTYEKKRQPKLIHQAFSCP